MTLASPSPRSSGPLVRVGQSLSAIEMDCSDWPRATGPRSSGQFEHVGESLPSVEMELIPIPDIFDLLAKTDDLELYGVGLLRRYDVAQAVSNAELQWFRETVGDLRDSMKTVLQVGVTEIAVYDALLLVDKKHSTKRQRRGVVVYGGKSSTLYITQQGIVNPRVRYEEVAHCLMGQIALDEVFWGTEYQGPATVYSPITNHKAIYTSFLQSRSFSECSADEKQVAVEITARLKDRARHRGGSGGDAPPEAHVGEVVLRLPRVGIVQSVDMLLLAS